MLPLVEKNAAEIEYLRQVEFSIAEANTYASRDDLLFIEEIGVELVDGGYLKPSGKGAEAENRARATAKKKGTKPKTGKAARKREMMSAIRVYTAPSGKEVYCGRNSRGNEAVSLHFGQDQDVWFHARGPLARTSSSVNSPGRPPPTMTFNSPPTSPDSTPNFATAAR